MQSSTTSDPGYQWESDKLKVDTTNGQEDTRSISRSNGIRAQIKVCFNMYILYKDLPKHMFGLSQYLLTETIHRTVSLRRFF